MTVVTIKKKYQYDLNGYKMFGIVDKRGHAVKDLYVLFDKNNRYKLEMLALWLKIKYPHQLKGSELIAAIQKHIAFE